MSSDGLEAGVQQCGVHAVSGLLRADRRGQRDLGQHGAGCPFAGVHGSQTGECRTVLNTVLAQAIPDLDAFLAVRVRGEQSGHVPRGRLFIVPRHAGRRRHGALARPAGWFPR